LTDHNVDDQGIGVGRLDLLKGSGHVVGSGDVVALVLEQVTDEVQEVRRAVDGEDVLALLLTAVHHGSLLTLTSARRG
jgi:hypothetical protein